VESETERKQGPGPRPYIRTVQGRAQQGRHICKSGAACSCTVNSVNQLDKAQEAHTSAKPQKNSCIQKIGS